MIRLTNTDTEHRPPSARKPAAGLITAMALLVSTMCFSDESQYHEKKEHVLRVAPNLTVNLVNTTQGTFWPPATVSDAEGNYILIGTSLEQREGDNTVRLYPFQAVIVSKNTVPPLDSEGRENFSNPFSAPYSIVRTLDLSPGSADLEMPLYTQSFGPYQGDFGGGGRSPKLGDSAYNLNALGGPGWEEPCPELFPADSQRFTYMIEGKPLNANVVPGFKGDNIAFDVNTGEAFVPTNRNGSECPPEGCVGEDPLDTRRVAPITLGEYLNQEAKLKIRLTGYSKKLDAYTTARFTVSGKHLLPNSIFQVVIGHASFLQGMPLFKLAHPASTPGIIVTDKDGRGKLTFDIKNPFPDPSVDDIGSRVVAIGLVLKSDFMVAGMCNYRFAPGVDVHAVASTIGDGNPDDFNQFLTVAPSER